MMGSLAGVLATKKIPTHTDRYRAEVEGDIENVGGILKITKIRVHYFLKVPPGKKGDVQEALDSYLARCPAAQSVIGCIDISHKMTVEEMKE